MVDKGFLIDEICTVHRIGIVRPPFLKGDTQFTHQASMETALIASARVHVERSIQRMKQ